MELTPFHAGIEIPNPPIEKIIRLLHSPAGKSSDAEVGPPHPLTINLPDFGHPSQRFRILKVDPQRERQSRSTTRSLASHRKIDRSCLVQKLVLFRFCWRSFVFPISSSKI